MLENDTKVNETKSSSSKAIVILTVLAVFIKLIGFVKNIIFSYYFGSNPLTDAYNISLTTPETFLNIISQATTLAFIPIYVSLLNKKGKEENDIFTSKFMLISFAFTTICMILLEVFPNGFIYLFASSFSEELISQASFFLRITSISLSLQGILTVLISYSQANKKFIIPSLVMLPLDIVYITLVILGYYFNNFNLLLYINLIAIFLQIGLFIPYLIKTKFRFRFSKPFFDENVKKVLVASIPILVSTVVMQMNNVIGRNFASQVEGAITNMSYAYLLTTIFEQVIVTSVAIVLYSDLSDNSSKDDIEAHKNNVMSALKFLIILVLPICLGLFLFSKEIAYLVYGRGEMTLESIEMISGALKGYSINLLFVSLSLIMLRALYSLNLKWLTIIVSLIGVSLNLGFTALFWYVSKLGVLGIALGAAIGNAIIAIFYLIYYCIKNKPLSFKGFIPLFFKIIIAIAISFVGGYLLQYFVLGNYIPQYGIIISIFLIIVIYFGLLILLKTKEIKEFLTSLKNRKKH